MTCPICDEYPVDCSCARRALRRLVEALPGCDVITDFDTRPLRRCGRPAMYWDEEEEYACEAHEGWPATIPVPWAEELRHALRVLGNDKSGEAAEGRDDE